MPKPHAKPIPGLGERLRQARQRAGMTLREAEPLLRIHYVSLCRYEIEEHTPSLKTLLKLCHVYQTSPNKLLGWSDRLNEGGDMGHDFDLVRGNFFAKVSAE